MFKLFGFRITPFFFFILSMECLALLISVYLGILLYKGTPPHVSLEAIDNTIYMGVLLIFLISILTPGFFFQVKVINKIKKSINEKLAGILMAFITMSVIVSSSHSSLDAKTLFIASILCTCIGLSVNKMATLSKYWRFLVRTGIN